MGQSTKMFQKSTLVLAIIFQHVAAEEKDNPCPPHWIQATWVDMGCLLFNSTTPLTTHEASSYCQKQENAILVEIQTEEQLDFLIMQLTALEGHGGKKSWHTGGTDFGREGRWYWSSSLTPVGDFVWRSSEPTTDTRYNCMLLYYGD